MATIANASKDDLCGVVSELESFWGDERDMGFLHQALYFHEFGDTAFVARGEDGAVDAYLLGFLGPQGVGYIHAVAVRDGHRGEGLARALYDAFEQAVRRRGALALKAITDPSNARSIGLPPRARVLGGGGLRLHAHTRLADGVPQAASSRPAGRPVRLGPCATSRLSGSRPD